MRRAGKIPISQTGIRVAVLNLPRPHQLTLGKLLPAPDAAAAAAVAKDGNSSAATEEASAGKAEEAQMVFLTEDGKVDDAVTVRDVADAVEEGALVAHVHSWRCGRR
jgi:hypothetical protein